MLVSGVLALDGTIRVKTEPGNLVKVYAWTAGGGPLLDTSKHEGESVGNGIYETTFDINVPFMKLQVMIFRDDLKVVDKYFDDYNTDMLLEINCSDYDCETVFGSVIPEEVIESIGNESIGNEIVEIENESAMEDNSVEDGFTGMAMMFVKDDGSINWVYSIGGGVIVLFFVVFLFLMVHNARVGKKTVVLDDEEKELKSIEGKVKERAEEIKRMKDKKDQKANLEKAKKKLAEEDAELKNLAEERKMKLVKAKEHLAEEEAELKELGDEGTPSEIDKQEDVIEKAEDKVDNAEDKVDAIVEKSEDNVGGVIEKN